MPGWEMFWGRTDGNCRMVLFRNQVCFLRVQFPACTCDATVECFLKVALCRLCMHRKVFFCLPRGSECFILLCLGRTFYWGIATFWRLHAGPCAAGWDSKPTSTSSVTRTWAASRSPPLPGDPYPVTLLPKGWPPRWLLINPTEFSEKHCFGVRKKKVYFVYF